LERGDDFVRKLAGQNFRIYPITARAIANLMISGEVEISPMTFASHVIASNADGAHLGWIPPGPLAVIDTVTALAAKAPHPHAAMLLIDFLMSKEGQLMYRDLGYESARTDMPASLLPPVKKMFLANRPTYMADFDTWTQTFRSLFERGAK
jgi:iron(III) transport system substrate-binding protein